MAKRFKVWDPEREDQPGDYNAEGLGPHHVAADFVEKRHPFLDEGDSVCVHVIDEKGALRRFTVDVRLERTFLAHEEKDPAPASPPRLPGNS